LKKWMSKIERNATEFYAKSRPSVLIHAKRSFVSLNTQSLMQHPEQYFNDEARYLKQGQSNTVVRANDVVIKRYNLKSPVHLFKNICRGSKANRAWRNAHLAQFMGIKTPEPLMMIEKRVCYIPSTSYFVSRFVEGESLFQINFNHVSPEEVAAMAAQISQYLNILKLSQCYHGDLKGSNWIWNGHDMYLMDLDSFRYIANPTAFAKYHEADLKRFMYNFDEAHVLKKALLILK
jgi:serine/threonine protein kinase